jgi:hypothetical protein
MQYQVMLGPGKWLVVFKALCVCLLCVAWGCSTEPPQEAAAKARAYALGQRVEVGQLIYTALEVQWVPQLGEGPEARLPTHRFLIVRMIIGNSGSAALPVPPLTLIGVDGTSFNEVEDASPLQDWFGTVRRLEGVQSRQGSVVFDVPRGEYKLKVMANPFDTGDENTAFIEIPPQFE